MFNKKISVDLQNVNESAQKAIEVLQSGKVKHFIFSAELQQESKGSANVAVSVAANMREVLQLFFLLVDSLGIEDDVIFAALLNRAAKKDSRK